MWKSKYNLQESVFFFHHTVSSDEAQVYSFGNMYLYLPRPLCALSINTNLALAIVSLKDLCRYLNQHRRSCMADIKLWIALKQSILYKIVDFQGVFCTRRLHLASSIWLWVRRMTTALDWSQNLHHLSDSTHPAWTDAWLIPGSKRKFTGMNGNSESTGHIKIISWKTSHKTYWTYLPGPHKVMSTNTMMSRPHINQ